MSLYIPPDENQPLLGAVGGSYPDQPPLYQESEPNSNATERKVKYDLSIATKYEVGGDRYEVECKVCGNAIDITEKQEQHVVKCEGCGEATPIRPAPADKKYVRCPCNCLLVCKATAQRIACPRKNCLRIINLSVENRSNMQLPQNELGSDGRTYHTLPNYTPVPEMCRVTCGHCYESFICYARSSTPALCPHCRQVSSVGVGYARTRGIVFMMLTIICFGIALGVTLGTKKFVPEYKGLIVLYVSLFVFTVIFLQRSCYYLRMGVSIIEDGAA